MKSAIVTGAGGSIGYAICKKLIDEGYHVVGLVHNPDKHKEKLAALGASFVAVGGDIVNSKVRDLVVNTATEKHGGIDLLVNTAGVAPLVRSDLLEITEESYDRVNNINAKSAFFLTQAVANQMLKQQPENDVKGYIVNISSCSAYTSSVNRGEYCISKASMSMMTTLFADRLAGESILVNEICPGIIDTQMTKGVKSKYDNLIEGGLVPLKRWGIPEDVANAVYVLCSGQMKYTTGCSLIVDGGMHIRRL